MLEDLIAALDVIMADCLPLNLASFKEDARKGQPTSSHSTGAALIKTRKETNYPWD